MRIRRAGKSHLSEAILDVRGQWALGKRRKLVQPVITQCVEVNRLDRPIEPPTLKRHRPGSGREVSSSSKKKERTSVAVGPTGGPAGDLEYVTIAALPNPSPGGAAPNAGGSATVVLAASVPALVALRGLPLDPSPTARLDTDDVRRAFAAAGCTVERASRPWRRSGRRFVQVRLAVADVRQASACGPLAWSVYTFEKTDTQISYRQTVGAAATGSPGDVNWDGSELVAFKLHLPSKVLHHNVRLLADNSVGAVERGNSLTWEQRLSDRRAGTPVAMEVITDAESILYQTMYLFAGAFAAAVAV